MFQWYEEERAKKKALPAARKKELKAEKDSMEEKYVYCLLDGRKEKVGNFKAEPPGLFRGRGDHPKKGALKVALPQCRHFSIVKLAGLMSSGRIDYIQVTSLSILGRACLFLLQTFLAIGAKSFTMILSPGSPTGRKISMATRSMSSLPLEVP